MRIVFKWKERHIMKTNNLKKITIHDHEYQDEENKY